MKVTALILASIATILLAFFVDGAWTMKILWNPAQYGFEGYGVTLFFVFLYGAIVSLVSLVFGIVAFRREKKKFWKVSCLIWPAIVFTSFAVSVFISPN